MKARRKEAMVPPSTKSPPAMVVRIRVALLFPDDLGPSRER